LTVSHYHQVDMTHGVVNFNHKHHNQLILWTIDIPFKQYISFSFLMY